MPLLTASIAELTNACSALTGARSSSPPVAEFCIHNRSCPLSSARDRTYPLRATAYLETAEYTRITRSAACAPAVPASRSSVGSSLRHSAYASRYGLAPVDCDRTAAASARERRDSLRLHRIISVSPVAPWVPQQILVQPASRAGRL